MARTSWKKCCARFASAAAIATLVCAASVWHSGDDAEACAGWSPSISDMTTFDPGVLGADSWSGLAYDPFEAGFGGACDHCSKAAMLADWQGFLKDAVTDDDWEQVLFKASLKDTFAIEQRLSGKFPPSNPGRVPTMSGALMVTPGAWA